MDRLLDVVVKQDASDLHLSCGRPPTVRMSGRLRNLATKTLEPEDMMQLMKSITPEKNQQELQEVGGTDFGFAFGTAARFRVSVFKQKGVLSMVLRQIPNKLLTFEQIGLPEICKELIRRPRGLFVITGPTGSGKTTSLATMIDYINNNLERHIITVEDPVEYYHYHKKSVINQRELHIDVPTFSEALRRALRQDPDVILVGEMRDLETIEAAIRAAETGHLVFGTIHASSAWQTFGRIYDLFPEEEREQIRKLLAYNLRAIIYQKLLPTLHPEIARMPAIEILLNTPAVQKFILEGREGELLEIIKQSKGEGMLDFTSSLVELVEKGHVKQQIALEATPKPEELRMRLKGIKT
jgi:twitching motility protein PilT